MNHRHMLLVLTLSGALVAAASAAEIVGDVNGDGTRNVADRVLLESILDGRTAESAAADVDGDGAVDSQDAEALIDLLLERTPYQPVGNFELPATGGSTTLGALTLTADADDFAESATVHAASAERSLGFDDDANSAVYRLDGIPYSADGAETGLAVALPVADNRRSGGTTMVLVGEEVNAPSSAGVALATRLVPALVANGMASIELPPIPAPPVEFEDEVPNTLRLYVQRVEGMQAEQYTVDDGTGTRAGLMLDLVTPATTTVEEKQRIVDAMANAAATIAGLGFDLTKRSDPVKIEVKKLSKGTSGYYQPSMVSLNWTTLEINQSLVTNPAKVATLRRTIIHEYFHMIQAWYDPRSAITQAKYNAPQLWIDEAASVWIEKYASGGTASDFMGKYAGEVMKGLHVPCSGLSWTNAAARTKAQNHGYGLSMMLEFLFSSHGTPENPTLANVYTSLLAGTSVEQSFLDAVPNPASWWDDMLIAYAQGDIGVPPVDFATSVLNKNRSLTFKKDHAPSDTLERTLTRLDEFESTVTFVNWNWKSQPPDHGKRHLVAELAADDDQFAIMGVQPKTGRKSGNMLRGKSMALGILDGRHHTLWTDEMTLSDNGQSLMPGHYLLARRLVDSAAEAARPVLKVWYVDTRVPLDLTQGSMALRKYTASGHIDCDQILKLDSYPLPILNVEMEGAINLPVSLAINSTADPDSYITTERYEIVVDHYNADTTQTSVDTFGPFAGENLAETEFSVTLAENDAYLVLAVQAAEDLKSSAPPGQYGTGTTLILAIVSRYDYRYEQSRGLSQFP